MAETTKSVRMNVETIRLVKVASSAANESMQAWVDKACRMRLEAEGKTAVADRRRVSSVTFEQEM